MTGTVRWSKWIPSKVNILAWRIFKGRVVVKEVLRSMGIIQNNMGCEVCKQGTESLSHVFLDCTNAKQVWTLILNWWRIRVWAWTGLEDLIEGLKNDGQNRLEEKALELIGYLALQII